MTRALRGHRRLARRGLRAGAASCAGTFPRCPTARSARAKSRARCAGCAKRWTTWSRTCSELGERVLQRAGPGGVPHLRRPDPHGAGRGVPGVGRDADPQQPAQRRDRLRVQGAGAAGTSGPAPRAAARAAGRPPRHPAPDDPSADGRHGDRSSGRCPRTSRSSSWRTSSRPGSRCSSTGSTSSGWSARRAPGRRTPRSWPTRSAFPAVMGAAGALAAIPHGHDAAARRPERHHRARSHPRRAGGGQDPGQPAAQARAAARGRGRASRRSRPTAEPITADGQRGSARGDRDRGAPWARRASGCCAPSSCSPAGRSLPTEDEQADYFRRVAARLPRAAR